MSYEKYKINEEAKSVQDLFTEIGLSDIINPYQITPAGQKLITAAKVPEIEDIYLRQYCCYEIPNSLERSFPGGKMKPFVLFLEVLNLLQDKGMDGFNKFETGLFIQKFQDHTSTLAKEIIEEVVEFRDKMSKCTTSKEIKAVKQEYLAELREFAGIDPNSVVRDYSDTTFRYFSLSGLFTRISDTIVIRPNKRDFAKKLLELEPIFMFSDNPIEYFKQFYWNSYQIPTDIKEFAL
ncbi:MAG: AlwI family type II restriction endonuclease, partial [Calditrichia bacterium]